MLSFIDKQQHLQPEWVNRVTAQILDYRPGIETLIVGTDSEGEGAHIFEVTDQGDVVRCDGQGFAAIGIGATHASTEFALSGYVRHLPLANSLLATYSAKRKAEVAPGVGSNTDMFYVLPNPEKPGEYIVPIDQGFIEELREIYDTMMKGVQTAKSAAITKITTRVEQHTAAALEAGRASEAKPH